MLTIYTDGSCFANGQKNAMAGWGFYSVDDKIKKNGIVPAGDGQTNNTGELMAVKQAIMHAIENDHESVLIFTDSKYCISTFTEWNIEKLVKGRTKKNYELIKSIMALFELIDVSFEWVRGHNGDWFNEEADRLANEAVSLYNSSK